MKQYFFLLAIVVGLFSCKKDKTESSSKDYTSIITYSVWTGEFNYAGKIAQPVNISFQPGGQATWYELRTSTNATWKLEDNLLIVSLVGGAGFTARIADDNTFTQIQNLPVNGFTLTSAYLNILPDQSLDGTSWRGTDIVMHFKAANKVDLELGPTGATKFIDVTYSRAAKTISFSPKPGYKWFIVIGGLSTLKGSNSFPPDPTVYTYEMSKD